ncbi:hypothetical protein BWQ96_04875 [Gracilariopsis chorda]|uniref:Uncharacterized protein n=1 Tax=Gracilariopsis chorda TaxID=448386 RepID=A0A2V3ITB2_9FLOR|nr:hypothetical protein BWQ96_04875 [Gracilariopsis chorda]|eukprot:PXF45355.1 hypothetical protein BWQ96_04875 [Gracilariopsis chorda]
MLHSATVKWWCCFGARLGDAVLRFLARRVSGGAFALLMLVVPVVPVVLTVLPFGERSLFNALRDDAVSVPLLLAAAVDADEELSGDVSGNGTWCNVASWPMNFSLQ